MSALAIKINNLASRIDELDETLAIPFFYKSYERQERQRDTRNKLAKEHNELLREYNKGKT